MKTSKTLVKFLVNDGELFAFFPQLNYNKRIYGNTMKTGYAHIGQHTSVHCEYAKESKEVTRAEYDSLLTELIGQGYDNLKVLNKY